MLGESLRRRWGARMRVGGRLSMPDWAMRVRWAAIALAALLASFGTGYALAVYVIFPAPEEAGTGTPVPELVGRRLAEAERELEARGLTVAEVVQIPHPRAPEGEVIAQSPLAGQWLRPGGAVRLGVSAGKPRNRVPEVTGLTAQNAAAMLERAGFEVRRREELSPLEKGRVVRTDPAGGTVLELPARVTLIVSAGPATPILPDLSEPAPDSAGVGPAGPPEERAWPLGPDAEE
jgi:beta-lactam-binding protein with PASTA domain